MHAACMSLKITLTNAVLVLCAFYMPPTLPRTAAAHYMWLFPHPPSSSAI